MKLDIIEVEGYFRALEVNSASCLRYGDLPGFDFARPMLGCVMEWMGRYDADSHMYTP